MSPTLTPEQQDQAERLAEQILQAARQDVLALAQLLVSRPDDQLLGRTECEVRDRVHQIGAKALELALLQRQKGGTTAPA